ncbi:MAG: ABC transporter permease [Zhaonellaceae bacterium]|jgi:ABC-type uncharacterized transport system permease subunit
MEESLFGITFLTGWLASSIRLMTIFLFGSLGAVFTARSGITNIGIEGMMLAGSFAAVWGSFTFNNPWTGVLIAGLAGALVALILAFLSVNVGTNQVVTGTIINLFALGTTSFLSSIVFGNVPPSQVPSLSNITIPLLSDIPFFGSILFQHGILTYLAVLLVPLVWWIMYRTPLGITIRAVGEQPQAADTLGINVAKVRYVCILISGFLSGLGGAFLSLGQLSVFMENMTAGKGYIALAALVLGKWHPFGVLGSSFLFGAADALQLRIQSMGLIDIPVEFLQMLPYLAAMIALAGFIGKATAPAAMGKPYLKSK